MISLDPHLRPSGLRGLAARERRWWRLLDDLPNTLRTVHRWDDLTAPPRAAADGHLHANPTSVVCLAGIVRVITPRVRLDLTAGEALVIAPGVWHRHAPVQRETVWFGQGFLAAWSDVVLGDHDGSWSGRVPSEPSRQLVEAALTEAHPLRRRARFVELMTLVLNESVDEQVFAHPALRAMLARMWAGLHLGVTVSDLVHASGLSRAQAYRVFVEGYGVPPKEALLTNRLWLAATLRRSGLGVSETAARCGFPSAATFARAWRREAMATEHVGGRHAWPVRSLFAS
jgi:AraC-like DNA-binding protein